jgi:hypothetical protein
MRSIYYSDINEEFIRGYTRIPDKNLVLCFDKIYEKLMKYSYTLDYNLNCKSIITVVSNNEFVDKNEFNEAYRIMRFNLNHIRINILEKIKLLRQLNIIDDKAVINYNKKYKKIFDQIEFLLENRYKFLSHILVEKKLIYLDKEKSLPKYLTK